MDNKIRNPEFPVTETDLMRIDVRLSCPHLKEAMSMSYMIGYRELSDFGLHKPLPEPDPAVVADEDSYGLQICLAERERIQKLRDYFINEIANKIAWQLTLVFDEQ